MKARVATSITKGNARESARAITQDIRAKMGGVEPRLLLAFASTGQPLTELLPDLSAQFPGTLVLGASTAGEFTEKGDAKSSACAFAIGGDYRCYGGIGTGLKDDPERAVQRAIEGLPLELQGFPHRTCVLLVDPLAGNGEETALIAASLLGDATRLAGGAAGDDLHMKQTFVGCGPQVASDAVALALIFSKSPLGVGVCHGHEPLSSPLRITRATGNVVHEIEGRPAWTVWLEHTRKRASERGIDASHLDPSAEGAFLLRYEAGLAANDAGTEFKIRAPLTRMPDGSISFACGIPEGSVIRITESLPERQIASARKAARNASEQLGGKAAGAVVFDCICRNLILDRSFADAVRGISDELGGVPIAGFETYGEIALEVGDMSGFHNTTSVVLAFPET